MAEGNLLVVDISQKSEWKLTCLNIDYGKDKTRNHYYSLLSYHEAPKKKFFAKI